MKEKREYIRVMRSRVMIVAQKELHWSKDFLNDMMEEWGFGRSLRKLSVGELNDIIRLMRGDIDARNLQYGLGKLDSQGKYMYGLMKDAGWDMKRLRGWWLKNMSASHWKGLKDSEKRATIAMLKKYKTMNNEELTMNNEGCASAVLTNRHEDVSNPSKTNRHEDVSNPSKTNRHEDVSNP